MYLFDLAGEYDRTYSLPSCSPVTSETTQSSVLRWEQLLLYITETMLHPQFICRRCSLYGLFGNQDNTTGIFHSTRITTSQQHLEGNKPFSPVVDKILVKSKKRKFDWLSFELLVVWLLINTISVFLSLWT